VELISVGRAYPAEPLDNLNTHEVRVNVEDRLI
jgi:hypothetical protein